MPRMHPGEAGQGRNPDLERGDGRTKLLFIDAFSGVAGDMLVAALIDLGVPEGVVRDAIHGLPLSGYRIEVGRRERSGIAAAAFDVIVEGPGKDRDYAAIRAMLEDALHLSPGARRLALAAFANLAQAEAEVHGMPIGEVHFHEVGAIDSIADIVGAAAGLDHVGARVVCSPLPMGRGIFRSRHGVLPSPAPATIGCLRGVPTFDAGIDAELVTPTGATLVATASSEFSRWPSMRPERVGWGAGTRELADRPNLLRLVLGTPDTAPAVAEDQRSTHVVLEANVDDMTGEIAAFALDRTLEAGALDAWTTPIGMKKGRPALLISALARREQVDDIARVLLTETTTLGLRVRAVDRIERPRRILRVETVHGIVAVKVADGDGLPPNVAPEYEACQELARATGVPVKQVYAAAIAAAVARLRTEPQGPSEP